MRNKRILITRPGSQGTDFANKLSQLGADAIWLPLIAIGEPDSWQALDEGIKNISVYDWIFFASSNAVKAFVSRLTANCPLPKIAAIGEVTANALEQYGLRVDYQPSNYLAEDFIAQFPNFANLNGCRILWPRTDIGRDLIVDKFQAVGANINTVPAYKTILPTNAESLSKELNQLLATKQLDAITLASKQTAINLFKIISLNLQSPSSPSQELLATIRSTLQDVLIVTIGPETSEGALNYLGKVSLEASPHTTDGMIAALTTYYELKENNNG